MRVFGGLGVQSYCFRGFKSNDDTVKKIRETGVAAVEICGVHADFKKPETFGKVIETYRKAGVAIVSAGVAGVGASGDEIEGVFDFARQAGAKFVSVTFSLNDVPRCYRTGERLAEKYDLRLAIHNHGGRHWLGSAEMLKHVFDNTSERVGLCLDTAWAMHSHEDPVKMTELFGKRLYGLHLKDFVFDRAGAHKDVPVGEGNLDLKALKTALESVNFQGYCVIEYEGDPENPVPALKTCVGNIKAAFGAALD